MNLKSESQDTDEARLGASPLGSEESADDRALAEWLPRVPGTDKTLCSRCARTGRFLRVRGRRCFACPFCRHQIYPLARLGYGRSTLPPAIWSKVTSLTVEAMCRKEIPRAVVLQRVLGVSNPTARRIRRFMIPIMASAMPPRRPPPPKDGALERAFDRVFQRVYKTSGGATNSGQNDA